MNYGKQVVWDDATVADFRRFVDDPSDRTFRCAFANLITHNQEVYDTAISLVSSCETDGYLLSRLRG